MIVSEAAVLNRGGFATGAALLDTLSHEPGADGPTGIDRFLAAAVYLRACALERARFGAAVEG